MPTCEVQVNDEKCKIGLKKYRTGITEHRVSGDSFTFCFTLELLENSDPIARKCTVFIYPDEHKKLEEEERYRYVETVNDLIRG